MGLFGRRKKASAAAAAPGAAIGAHGRDEPAAGALTPLLTAVLDHTLPLDVGCQRAAELAARGSVTPAQLEDLSEAAFQQSRIGWAPAWSVARILYAAADSAWAAAPDRAAGAAFVKVCADLVSVAAAGLDEAGDIRLFDRARLAADRGISVAGDLGIGLARGVLLQRRGSMILDCYTSGRTAANHAAEFQHWVEKAIVGDLGLLAAVSAPVDVDVDEAEPGPAAAGWPTPIEAMDLAEQDLRGALALVGPDRRGRVLKALSQVLEWRQVFGGPAVGDELIQVAEDALAALAPDDVQGRLAVAQTLARARGSADADQPGIETLIGRMEHDWTGYVAEATPLQAWDAAGQAARMLSERDLERALRLLDRRRSLASVWAIEARRSQHRQLELQLFARAASPAWVQQAWADAEQLRAIASMVRSAAHGTAAPPAGQLTSRELAGALTTVMLASTKFDLERIGLQALDLLAEAGGGDWAASREAYREVGAALHHGEAINCEHRGQLDDAVKLFLAAAGEYRCAGSPDAMVTSLTYVAELISAGGVGDLGQVSAWCAAYALKAEILIPQAGPEALQRLMAVTLASQVQHGMSPDEMHLLFSAAKGRRFASLLATGTTGWTADATTARLLAEVAAAEGRLPVARALLAGADWERALDRDDLVTAYASEFEQSPGGTPEGDLVNQKRGAERHIMAQLAGLGDADNSPVLLPAVREALDARTALLLMYEGVWTDGHAATYALLLTDTDTFPAVGVDQLPGGIVLLKAEGRELRVPPSGPYVARVRRAVQAEPAPEVVSREGRRLLESVCTRYARPVLEHLDELHAAGKDRLLVVPHGATHFLPLHLARTPDGRLVADDWTVCYLAHISQLTSGERASPQRLRRAGAAVFALGYADQPGLPPVESSAAEGQAIGDILGVAPSLDSAATERAFTRALQSCRYVHLRAHGQHDIDAPLFQTVFLAPGDGGDGRLRAHEVLSLDLRGLELVTLGACETALGRVDISDNLRGLPAALMLAGAQAVIGTLWDVSAEASTTFFTALYRSLRAMEDDLLGAFGAAQRATRSAHPEYRDWGAFHLTGGYGGRNDVT